MSSQPTNTTTTKTTATAISTEQLNHPRSLAAFRSAKLLVGGYLTVSVLTLVAIILLRNNASVVNAAVWIRGTIVVASALLSLAFAAKAARGSRGAYRRLRIFAPIMVVAIATIIALPGTFPVWMKLEQGLCGLILIGLIVVLNGGHLRSVFATR